MRKKIEKKKKFAHPFHPTDLLAVEPDLFYLFSTIHRNGDQYVGILGIFP
jgi:hypothetical protein